MIDCDCRCHTNPDIVHCVACCNRCPYCGARIRMVFYESHMEECIKEHQKVYKEVTTNGDK